MIIDHKKRKKITKEEILNNLKDWSMAGNTEGGFNYKGNEDDVYVSEVGSSYFEILNAFLKEIEENPQDWKIIGTKDFDDEEPHMEYFVNQVVRHKSGRTHYTPIHALWGFKELKHYYEEYEEKECRWEKLEKILKSEKLEDKTKKTSKQTRVPNKEITIIDEIKNNSSDLQDRKKIESTREEQKKITKEEKNLKGHFWEKKETYFIIFGTVVFLGLIFLLYFTKRNKRK